MRVLFAGTPDFAARCLATLLESRHGVCGVMTQPDRPAGRGLEPSASAVKRLASERGIRVIQPASLKDAEVSSEVGLLGADIIVTAAFGLIFPQSLLDLPPRGAVNVHASLLPRWRGAAPIQRALLAGDTETGVSIMRMDAGLDTGPVFLREAVAILASDTAGTLEERLAELGGKLVVRVLDALERGELAGVPQPTEGATHAPKLKKEEFQLDWSRDAAALERCVRAFNPWPGAGARVRGVDLKIWSCDITEGKARAGEVLGADIGGLRVACGRGALRVTELQRAGAKRLRAAEFLRGFPLTAGERFECQAPRPCL